MLLNLVLLFYIINFNNCLCEHKHLRYFFLTSHHFHMGLGSYDRMPRAKYKRSLFIFSVVYVCPDHTKQAAILLMTGHTPKCRLSSPQPGRSPSFGTKHGVARRSSRASPGNCRATAGNSRATPAHSRATLDNSPATPGYSRATPGNSRATPGSSRATPVDKSVADQTVSIIIKLILKEC